MSVPVVRNAQELADLERAYVWSVNSAVEAGSRELADELADDYGRESGATSAEMAA